MIKTDALAAFAAVVKYGGFTAAANARGQTPMAVSKQIAQLESNLGEALFERTTRSVKLTEFGGEFLLRAKEILQQHALMDDWIGARRGKVSGCLRLVSQSAQTYDETVFPFLAEFHQLCPELTLSFDVRENILDIATDPYDIYWGIGEYLGERHKGLKRRLMWRAQYGIFASPDYLQKFGVPQTPDELQGHQMIGHVHQQPDNVLVVNHQADSQQSHMEAVELYTPINVVNGHAQLAVQGLGLINALSDNHDIKQLLTEGRLLPVLQPYWYSAAELFIYYHQVKFEQAKVRAFIDYFLSKRSQW